ncbi:MAG: glycosyltransferase family 39 protein [Betaproteobacteria bacterium]
MTVAPAPARWKVLALLAVLALVWFANLDARRLIRPDEGRYAEIAREMAATNDWITPRLNGIKYFEKPPLQYWFTAAAYRVFGPDEWTARLYTAVTGALTILLVWRTGRRIFGAPAGMYAGLVATGMLWMVANGHLNTLDMGLTLWLTAGLAGLLWAQRDQATRTERRNGMLFAWAAAALAILSKGLIGVVLPAGALVLYALIARDLRLIGRLHLLQGCAVMAAITVPWFLAVSIANPEFPGFFFIHEHFERFLTTVHRRQEPWWYFGPLLLAGALPWTLLALQAVFGAVGRDMPSQRFRPNLFLLIWCAFVVLFFSTSQSKLPSYILPVFPALAWLMGDQIKLMRTRALAWHGAVLIPLAVVAVWLGVGIEKYANARTTVAMYAAFEPWIIAAAGVMLVAAIACIFYARREHKTAAVLVLSVGGLGAWQLALTGHDALAPSFSAAALAAQARPRLRADCPIYSLRTYDQTLPFYLGRTVTLVAFADEMAFGLEREPQLALPSMDDFAAAWASHPCSYAFMESETFDELRAAGFPMTLLARDTRRVIVGNPHLTSATAP